MRTLSLNISAVKTNFNIIKIWFEKYKKMSESDRLNNRLIDYNGIEKYNIRWKVNVLIHKEIFLKELYISLIFLKRCYMHFYTECLVSLTKLKKLTLRLKIPSFFKWYDYNSIDTPIYYLCFMYYMMNIVLQKDKERN